MKFVRTGVLIGTVLALATACGGAGSGSGGAGSGSSATPQTPVLHIPADPGVLDPQFSPGSWARPMMRFAYDTLVADSKDGVVPQLAESWDVTPTKATFTIRSGVTCANGEAMDAKAVAANFDRLKDPEAPFTSFFLGSTDYKVSYDESARTVTLDLPKPFSPLLTNLVSYPLMICPEGLKNTAALNTKSFGTGPFVLGEVKAGQSYTFDRRDDYAWGPDGATSKELPKSVKISVVDNETTASNLMLRGDLNLGIFSTRGAYERLEGDGFTSQKLPAAATYVHFNFLKKDSPIQDPGVRKALGQALDRSALSKIVTGADDQTSDSVALPQSICQSDVSDADLVEYDVNAAEADLQSAGWTKSGSGWTKDGMPLKIDLLVSGASGSGNKPVADYTLDAWSKLGVDLSVEDVDQATGLDRRVEGNYDVWIGTWTSVWHPSIISPFLTSPSSPTYTYLANKEYNALAEQAYNMDPEQTCPVWGQAQTAINKQVSMVPLYYDVLRYVGTEGLTFAPYSSYIDPVSLRVDSE